MTKASHEFKGYALSDRYNRTEGRVFLTGTQALARIMFDQARRDREARLNTAGSPIDTGMPSTSPPGSAKLTRISPRGCGMVSGDA